MKTGKAFVYLENIDDDDINLMSCTPDSEKSLFTFELSEVGYNKEWGDLSKYPTGYYELEYEWDQEHEYCDGYVANTYAIIVQILSLKRSFKAWYLWQKSYLIEPKVDFALSLFQPRWKVEFDYGGGGICESEMYLPYALWRRFIGHRIKEPAWGPGSTLRLRRE